MKATEWAFDRIQEAFERVAKDEAKKKLSTVQEVMLRGTDFLRRIIAPAEGARRRYDVILAPALYQFPVGRLRFISLMGEKHTNWWVCELFQKYDWKQPNRLLVVRTGESVDQAKVFRAHAVPQGLCGNPTNALKLVANQQEDGDGIIQNIWQTSVSGAASRMG